VAQLCLDCLETEGNGCGSACLVAAEPDLDLTPFSAGNAARVITVDLAAPLLISAASRVSSVSCVPPRA
jgi:hypothetical protein